MQINTSQEYRDTGPLIYEDPNKLGPKDRYILVRVNMFDAHSIHPRVIQKYIFESLKTKENRDLLKEINSKEKRFVQRESGNITNSPRVTVPHYINSLNKIIVKMNHKVREKSPTLPEIQSPYKTFSTEPESKK